VRPIHVAAVAIAVALFPLTSYFVNWRELTRDAAKERQAEVDRLREAKRDRLLELQLELSEAQLKALRRQKRGASE
jgi:hypothetical protein